MKLEIIRNIPRLFTTPVRGIFIKVIGFFERGDFIRMAFASYRETIIKVVAFL